MRHSLCRSLTTLTTTFASSMPLPGPTRTSSLTRTGLPASRQCAGLAWIGCTGPSSPTQACLQQAANLPMFIVWWQGSMHTCTKRACPRETLVHLLLHQIWLACTKAKLLLQAGDSEAVRCWPFGLCCCPGPSPHSLHLHRTASSRGSCAICVACMGLPAAQALQLELHRAPCSRNAPAVPYAPSLAQGDRQQSRPDVASL